MKFEKLGDFYLGKEYDIEEGRLIDRLLMYDARDLTTHAVCVGMTGSGKTGLCIDLLEEAAIDNVPAIIIDPKGDMSNLLLTFPDLRPKDFRPWVNTDDARRKGLSLDEFASQQAQLWRKGLGEWGQDSSRIQTLRDAADWVVYTPGSSAGVEVSILDSFSVPQLSWDTEGELIRERIEGIVSAILGLVGVDADPVRSREHILLANLFEHFWRQGEALDLPKLILAIQKPPLRKLGVFDVDTFFPVRDRSELAMSLNNLIAAPSFQSWVEGQALDIPTLLATPTGKPRHSIFSIAHLNDAERMFFVTILLNQVISWMRSQPGTTSLRALLYMDEIFGFFPPVANPPSKKPMLTLLKQARAFGLGVVLSTQNPVDLDYKGLSNAGTWFIGRLQTKRDRERVVTALEGASSEAGKSLDRAEMGRLVSDLGKRVFLMHNVHEEAPQIFQTRWAMSYLRGPLTRDQIGQLMSGRKPEIEETTSSSAQPTLGMGAASQFAQARTSLTSTPATSTTPLSTASLLPSDIQQVYIPISGMQAEERKLIYRPALLAAGQVHFIDRKRDVDEVKNFSWVTEPPMGTGILRWEDAVALELRPRDLNNRPEPEALFEEVPESINQARKLKAFERDLSDHLYRSSTLELWYNPSLKIYSQPGESERDFRLRLKQELREKRDSEVDKLNRKHEKQLRKLESRLRRAQVTLEKREATAQSRKREVFLSVGESVLGMFLGRKSMRAASASMSKYRMSSSAKMSAQEVEETVKSLQEEISDLEEELLRETEEISQGWEGVGSELDKIPITPRRRDIEIDLFAVAWTPSSQLRYQDAAGVSKGRNA